MNRDIIAIVITMEKRVSIRDLASIAGVSRTTVSLALRDSHRISDETRSRIQALAKEHGYRGHPSVSALMQQVGRGRKIYGEEIIAFILSGRYREERATGPSEIIAGAAAEADRMGYRLEVFWAGYMARDSEKLARTLYNRGIRGVIWGAMPYPHPPIVFPWHQFVPIASTHSTDVPNLPVVCINHAKGCALLLQELEARGATQIGFFEHHVIDWRQDFGWILGVDLYRHRGGKAKVVPLNIRSGEKHPDIASWVKRKNLDALVLPQEFIERTTALHIKVPRVSLDVPSNELGRIAGLYQNSRAIGEHTVRSLSVRLSNNILGLPQEPFSVVMQAAFVDGESLGRFADPQVANHGKKRFRVEAGAGQRDMIAEITPW